MIYQRRTLCGILFLLFLATGALGQEVTASITGLVTDPSGGVGVGATVTAMQEAHHAGALTGWGANCNPPLPPERSFLSLTPKNVAATAIKVSQEPWAPDALVVRGHETAGRVAQGELSLGFDVVDAQETNLIEEPSGNQVRTEGNKVYFQIRAREIKTLKLAVRTKG